MGFSAQADAGCSVWLVRGVADDHVGYTTVVLPAAIDSRSRDCMSTALRRMPGRKGQG